MTSDGSFLKKSFLFTSCLFLLFFLAGCNLKSSYNCLNSLLYSWSVYDIENYKNPDSQECKTAKETFTKEFNNFIKSENYFNYGSIYTTENGNFFINYIDEIKKAIDNNNYSKIGFYITQIYQIDRINYFEASTHYFRIIVILVIILTTIFVLLYILMNKYEKELINSTEVGSYSMFMIDAIQKERNRISKELHDTVLQEMKFIEVEAELINSTDSKDLLHKTKIIESTKKNISSLREICKNLTPPELHVQNSSTKGIINSSEIQNGLIPALINLTNIFSSKTNIPCTLKIQKIIEELNIPIHIASQIFRIAQETFSNIENHSKAKNTSLMLIKNLSANSIILYIVDDGIGFDLNKVPQEKKQNHFGLKNLYERARLINGKLQIITAPGEGTEIRLEVPLK